MAIYIHQLDETYPDGSVHKVYVIDDDLKQIKQALKDTFPNIGGAVIVTHTELNYLDNLTGNLQEQINTQSARISTLQSRGAVYAGRVGSDGSAVQLPVGWSAELTGTGVYTISYPGKSNITVDLIIDASSTTNYWKYNAFVGSINTDSFVANTVDVTTGSAVAAGFYFHMHANS